MYHWYVYGDVPPVAATLNVTEAPAVTVWLVGWVVIANACVLAETVTRAEADLEVSATLVALTL